ncbi:proton channel OTOP2 [Melanotaenia boesemani]|uniref:proton channel OTOP2 n=1 Tax=Melanotaenia boesemani TaxID=1250792 RepID=UPI001C03D135|nr:proton channel OTOP2 [Melanotaenia boesemani]
MSHICFLKQLTNEEILKTGTMCYKSDNPCECLTSGSLCEPCKMTTKGSGMDGTHLSSNRNAAGQPNTPELNISSTEVVKDQGRNWGWMLSAIICLNNLILGCALVSTSASNNVKISSINLQAFLIVLLLLTSIWMIYYTKFTAKIENAVVYKDQHAGPIWLRGGLLLFGLLSIIMDVFKIASYVGYLHCDSGVKVAFPVVQLIFVLVQTYFLWIHSKDCVQLQKNISRCGLMLTLSTNLVLWMSAVTDESVHLTTLPDSTNHTKLSGRSLYISKSGYGDQACVCSHTACSIFKEAYFYLYPFNSEYSLFASAMAYIMWKNVGRVAAESSHHHHIKFSIKEVFIGPTLGVLLVIAGLATFIIYEIEMQKNHFDDKRDKVLMMHFTMNIVIVTMMSVCTVVGSVIFKLDNRELVSEKNPTRNLDVGLLVGASLGQFIISYFSIVAMVATGAKGYLNMLNLAWAIMMVIQLGLQNFFIIEGLHRKPFQKVEPDAVIANPYVLEANKYVNSLERADMEKKPNLDTAANSPSSTAEQRHKLWKRRVLREVCMFLLLGNIILWIMPAFGARPQFDHVAETEFYQFNMWAAIVNIGLPFGIFYRMHAVASLFEVFLNS